MPTVLVRADASVQIGTGHIMRTLTLSNELKKNSFEVIFLTKKLEGNLDEVIVKNGFEVINVDSFCESDEVLEIIKRKNASLIIFDNYGIDYEYEKKIKQNSDIKIFSFDDTGEKHFCDILLNQNIYAKKEDYKGLVPQNCYVLAGAQYALLRDEFKNIKIKEKIEIDRKKINILVTLGGSDERNVGENVMQVIEKIDDLNLFTTVIAGKSNPHFLKLENFAKNSKKDFLVLKSSENMAQLMNDSDIAITAGGSTVLEVLFLLLPSITIELASNQHKIVQELKKRELSIAVDECVQIESAIKKLCDLQTRKHLIENMRAFFKDNLQDEIVKAIKKKIYEDFKVVSASFDDCENLFLLANDEEVRKNSFSQNKIELNEHKAWLKKALEDKTRALFVLKLKDVFLGQIRFDKIEKTDDYLISFSIAKEIRGLSLSSLIIKKSIEKFSKNHKTNKIIAHIKKENTASLKAFEKAGFKTAAQNEFITMECEI
ncbi:MAG: UDP-2,4-diacetamido-2,4, 6-trideoxy-beta-L-altropyranose hydrolase [Campylobacterota bacterium]|nr:UDP-2,4-diacetamido-2,4, 6-trideoxy-beta-L-altropyranose hydrolase [Campylobacterota bacterium]